MKILVPCKRVPDPDQKLRLNAEATDIDPAALTYILNPFDAIAVEEALRIRETAKPDAEIIAVSIAHFCSRVQRWLMRCVYGNKSVAPSVSALA